MKKVYNVKARYQKSTVKHLISAASKFDGFQRHKHENLTSMQRVNNLSMLNRPFHLYCFVLLEWSIVLHKGLKPMPLIPKPHF